MRVVAAALTSTGGGAATDSPAFTGTPTAPTAAAGTSTTQLATTAFATVADALKADLASPTFTGTPAAPTAAAATSTTQLATTAFATTADNLKANLASPTFTGTPAAPTAAAGTSTTQVATTAFVAQATSYASVQTAKTTAYTLVQGDSGSFIPVNSASSVAITVPVLTQGSSVELLRQGAGAVTLTASGTTLTGPTGATLQPRVTGSSLSLLWLSTTDVRVFGDLA